jgi:hypothetical protein
LINQSGSLVSCGPITGSYSLYVRAHDLILDDVYYLPPWDIEFTVDGGPVQTTWQFNTLPGGADDTAYLNDFYKVPPTCGDYECRDYYIDLGFIPGGQFVFPTAAGAHTVSVTVRDYAGNSATQACMYTVTGGTPPAVTVWQDDFESDLGWVTNPLSDTATSGFWERADPEATFSIPPDSTGIKQLGWTQSPSNDLVTGAQSGGTAADYDVDGGVTSMRATPPPRIICG